MSRRQRYRKPLYGCPPRPTHPQRPSPAQSLETDLPHADRGQAMRFEDFLPQGTEAMWSCGHVGGAVCAECHRELMQKTNELTIEVSRLRDLIAEYEARLRDCYDRGQAMKLIHSNELTREEEALRSELRAWCRGKLASGTRPIPLQAALRIVADQMSDPEGHGIGRYKPRRPMP